MAICTPAAYWSHRTAPTSLMLVRFIGGLINAGALPGPLVQHHSIVLCVYLPHQRYKHVSRCAEFGFMGPIAFDVGKFIGNLFIAFFASDGHASEEDHRSVLRQCDMASLLTVSVSLQCYGGMVRSGLNVV